MTVIYLNLRVAKEDLTRETLSSELGMDDHLEVVAAVIETGKRIPTREDHDII